MKFTAKAQINGAKKQIEPNKILLDDAIPDEVLSGAEEALIEEISERDVQLLSKLIIETLAHVNTTSKP